MSPVSGPLITVVRGHTYLAIAQSGTVLRAFLYGAQGQHLETLGVIELSPQTPQLSMISLLDAGSRLLWLAPDPQDTGSFLFYNWLAGESSFTTRDVQGEDAWSDAFVSGTFWGLPGTHSSVWNPQLGFLMHEYRALTTEADGHRFHLWADPAQIPAGWTTGTDFLVTGSREMGAIPTEGAIWSQAYDNAGSNPGKSNHFAYFLSSGDLPLPHTGTVSALNQSEADHFDMREQHKTPGAQTYYGGIVVLNRTSTGKDLIAHLPHFAQVGATGTLTQLALTPSSWNITASAGHSLQVSPDGTEFAWYDPTTKKFIRHSTNPTNAITEGDSLAARQVEVEDAPGGHAIQVLIPLD